MKNRLSKRWIAVGLVSCIALAMAACGSSSSDAGDSSTAAAQTAATADTAQIANPWQEFDADSLEDAEAYAGITVVLPTALDEYMIDSYRAMDGLIEGVYKTSEGQGLVVRKGTGDTEISGDYNDYAYTDSIESEEETESDDGVQELVYRGESESSIRVVTWRLEGFQYAIVIDADSEGIPIEDMSNFATYLVDTNSEASAADDTGTEEEISDSQAAEEMLMQQIASDIQLDSEYASDEIHNLAAEALNWATVTDLSAEEARSIAVAWKGFLSDEDLEIYEENMAALLEVAQKAVDGDEETLALMEDDSEEFGTQDSTAWTEDSLAILQGMQ